MAQYSEWQPPTDPIQDEPSIDPLENFQPDWKPPTRPVRAPLGEAERPKRPEIDVPKFFKGGVLDPNISTSQKFRDVLLGRENELGKPPIINPTQYSPLPEFKPSTDYNERIQVPEAVRGGYLDPNVPTREKVGKFYSDFIRPIFSPEGMIGNATIGGEGTLSAVPRTLGYGPKLDPRQLPMNLGALEDIPRPNIPPAGRNIPPPDLSNPFAWTAPREAPAPPLATKPLAAPARVVEQPPSGIAGGVKTPAPTFQQKMNRYYELVEREKSGTLTGAELAEAMDLDDELRALNFTEPPAKPVREKAVKPIPEPRIPQSRAIPSRSSGREPIVPRQPIVEQPITHGGAEVQNIRVNPQTGEVIIPGVTNRLPEIEAPPIAAMPEEATIALQEAEPLPLPKIPEIQAMPEEMNPLGMGGPVSENIPPYSPEEIAGDQRWLAAKPEPIAPEPIAAQTPEPTVADLRNRLEAIFEKGTTGSITRAELAEAEALKSQITEMRLNGITNELVGSTPEAEWQAASQMGEEIPPVSAMPEKPIAPAQTPETVQPIKEPPPRLVKKAPEKPQPKLDPIQKRQARMEEIGAKSVREGLSDAERAEMVKLKGEVQKLKQHRDAQMAARRAKEPAAVEKPVEPEVIEGEVIAEPEGKITASTPEEIDAAVDQGYSVTGSDREGNTILEKVEGRGPEVDELDEALKTINESKDAKESVFGLGSRNNIIEYAKYLRGEESTYVPKEAIGPAKKSTLPVPKSEGDEGRILGMLNAGSKTPVKRVVDASLKDLKDVYSITKDSIDPAERKAATFLKEVIAAKREQIAAKKAAKAGTAIAEKKPLAIEAMPESTPKPKAEGPAFLTREDLGIKESPVAAQKAREETAYKIKSVPTDTRPAPPKGYEYLDDDTLVNIQTGEEVTINRVKAAPEPTDILETGVSPEEIAEMKSRRAEMKTALEGKQRATARMSIPKTEAVTTEKDVLRPKTQKETKAAKAAKIEDLEYPEHQGPTIITSATPATPKETPPLKSKDYYKSKEAPAKVDTRPPYKGFGKRGGLKGEKGEISFDPVGFIKDLGKTGPVEAVKDSKFVKAIKDAWKESPADTPIGKAGEVAGNAMKSAMATGDLSAPLRQGAALMHRGSLGKENMGKMIKMFGDEKVYQAAMDEIKNDPMFKRAVKDGVEFTGIGGAKEEKFASQIMEEIPGYGRVVRASDRAYTGYLNKLRFDTYKSMLDDAVKGGFAPVKSRALSKDIAKFVNEATGRGSFKHEGAARLLNSIGFSPRLLKSRVQLINRVLNPFNYAKQSPLVRREAYKSALSLLGFNATVGALTAGAAAAGVGGAKYTLNPLNSDFGKARFGNTRLDFMAGFQQPAVLAARIAMGEMTSSVSGKTTKLGTGYGQTSQMELIGRFLQSKEAPIVGLANELWTGKDWQGQDQSRVKAIAERLTPMIVSDFVDLMKEDPRKAPLIIPGILGASVQTYGKPKKTFSNRQMKLSMPTQ